MTILKLLVYTTVCGLKDRFFHHLIPTENGIWILNWILKFLNKCM